MPNKEWFIENFSTAYIIGEWQDAHYGRSPTNLIIDLDGNIRCLSAMIYEDVKFYSLAEAIAMCGKMTQKVQFHEKLFKI
jgi:hypothetical protein